jgi:hypothetical protein
MGQYLVFFKTLSIPLGIFHEHHGYIKTSLKYKEIFYCTLEIYYNNNLYFGNKLHKH